MGKGGSKNGLGANLLQKSKTKEKWDLCQKTVIIDWKTEKNGLCLIYFWENDARDKVGVKLLKEEDRQVITS